MRNYANVTEKKFKNSHYRTNNFQTKKSHFLQLPLIILHPYYWIKTNEKSGYFTPILPS